MALGISWNRISSRAVSYTHLDVYKRQQFGRLLKETIESAGIDSRNLEMDEEVNTTLAFVHTDKDLSLIHI